MRNQKPFCKNGVSECLAAAGGIGNINTPYYRTPAPGEEGCGGMRPRRIGGGNSEFVLNAGDAVAYNGNWVNPSCCPTSGRIGAIDPEQAFGSYVAEVTFQSDKDAVGEHGGIFQIIMKGMDNNRPRFNKVTVTDITRDIHYGRKFTVNLCHFCGVIGTTKSCQYVMALRSWGVAPPAVLAEVAKISFSCENYRTYHLSFARGEESGTLCPPP